MYMHTLQTYAGRQASWHAYYIYVRTCLGACINICTYAHICLFAQMHMILCRHMCVCVYTPVYACMQDTTYIRTSTHTYASYTLVSLGASIHRLSCELQSWLQRFKWSSRKSGKSKGRAGALSQRRRAFGFDQKNNIYIYIAKRPRNVPSQSAHKRKQTWK